MCRTSHNSSCSKRNDCKGSICLFPFSNDGKSILTVSFISQLPRLEFLLSLVKFLLLNGQVNVNLSLVMHRDAQLANDHWFFRHSSESNLPCCKVVIRPAALID
jgi:hypothetical protein